MTVDKKEILDLHKYVLKEIDKINASSSPDATKLFDLNILDSNLSLVIAGFDDDLEHEEVELGSRDKQIKDALQEYRKSQKTTGSDGGKNIIAIYSQHASELCEQINAIVEELDFLQKQKDSEILAKNFEIRFLKAKEYLMEASLLTQKTKAVQKQWQTEKVSLAVKSAASALGSMTSEKKAKSSRENGKLGGRPKSVSSTKTETKKSSVKKTDSKTTSKKTAASKSESKKSAVKSASKTSSKGKK